MGAKTFDRQTAKFLAVVGENMPALSGEIMQVWIEHPQALQSFLKGLSPSVVKESALLSEMTTVQVEGAKEFRAKDHFVVNTSKYALVKINYLGDNFKELFFEKEEVGVAPTILIIHELKKASFDAPILAEFGEKAETSICHLWQMLVRQSKGELGPLLTNGSANIFYIRGIDGNFWAVGASLGGDGWGVDAFSVEYPYRWPAGFRVISR